MNTQAYDFVEDRLREAREMGEMITIPVDLTPDLAQELLNRNTNNRPIKPHHRSSLVRMMNNDQYVYNSQTMSVSESGRLANGQHRASAVVTSGKTVRVLISFGEPDAASFTHDLGSSRTAGDMVKFAGFPNAVMLSAITKLIVAYENTLGGEVSDRGFSGHTVNSQEIMSRLEADDGERIQAAAAFAVKLSRNLRPRMDPSMAGFCHWLLGEANSVTGPEFMMSLATQNGTTQDDPEWHLGRALEEMKAKKIVGKGLTGNPAKVLIAEMVVRAYNAKRIRGRLKRLSSNEGFIPQVTTR